MGGKGGGGGTKGASGEGGKQQASILSFLRGTCVMPCIHMCMHASRRVCALHDENC